jgi:hypothetical protein
LVSLRDGKHGLSAYCHRRGDLAFRIDSYETAGGDVG